MLAKNPSLYTGAKRCIAVLPRARERLEAALHKLGRLYPDARFPPVTVAIGRGKPVAMGAPDTGLQGGLEALCAFHSLHPDVQDLLLHVPHPAYPLVQHLPAASLNVQGAPT